MLELHVRERDRILSELAALGLPRKVGIENATRKCSVAMPDHKVKISISRDRKPWWRIWNEYPDPTRDALLALFGIVVIVMVIWFLLSI
jgi:hypothetical protein